ncbi:MBG domain-containing protein [Azospirillum humicireducens]|nr:MBG domain-containing protein [Azospirillum humicireducens]
MNRAFRLIWNRAKGRWVVAPETAKGGGWTVGAVAVAALIASTGPARAEPATTALPTGGQVVAGSVSIGANGSSMTVTQQSARGIVNWKSFDVGSDASVTFKQPDSSSVTLNRVTAGAGSVIAGKLSGNGKVYVVNPNGVLFTKTARVDVGGLVASTADIADNDFMAGREVFTSNGATGSVINQGTINAGDGGAVVLIGGTVSNQGTINARNGNAVLAAGAKVTLDAGANGHLKIEVDGATTAALVENGGLISASGGQVVMTAKGASEAVSSVVSNTGTVEAQTLGSRAGKVALLAGMKGGEVKVAGTIDASAPSGGNGGAVETSAAKVTVAPSAKVTTLAAKGKTGNWLIDPYNVTISTAADSGAGFTATADDTVINVTTLTNALASTGVTVSTGSSGSQAGNITVAAPISWSANTTLTLDAAGSIAINKDITATGTSAGLSLTYGGNYILGGGARVTLSGASAALSLGGTAYTLVHDVTALQSISGSGNYALAEDIDAAATSSWNSGVGFTSIGTDAVPFSGTLAGLGHAIDRLTMNSYLLGNKSGLFGFTLGATLRDFTLSNVSITGTARVGAVVGWSSNTSLTNLHVTGSVSGYQEVGGIAGWFSDSTMTGSSSTASVTATSNTAGGLIGNGYYGVTVSDSYATGVVSASTKAGGLIGEVSTDGSTLTLTNVYASGAVSAPTAAGGLVGSVTGVGTTVNATNAYWDADSTGQSSSAAGTSITNANAYTEATYSGFDFTNTWVTLAGETRPMLRSEYSTVIFTPHALQLMQQDLTASYKLGANLSMTPAFTASGGYYGDVWGSSGFKPVGDFSGSFNGQSHTIAGLTINRGSTQEVGLFGVLTGAVSDVGLVGGSITASDSSGSLVGSIPSTGTVTRSYSTASVSGTGNFIGGLVGINDGAISLSSFGGAVTTTGSVVGGLVGGLLSSGTISDSYATGSVSGANWIGGLVGAMYGGTISHAYSTARVSGPGNKGGLTSGGTGTVTESYWDTQTSGTGVGPGTTRTTALLQGSLPTGFSSAIWGTGTNLYPYFKWQYSTTPVAVSGRAYSDAGASALAGATVTAISNGASLGSAITGANGYYYILKPSGSINTNGALAYLDGQATKAAAFGDTVAATGVTGLNIYGSSIHLVTGESSLSATRTAYTTTMGSYSDTDLSSFLSSSTFGTLTTAAGYGVYLDASSGYSLNTALGSAGLLSLTSGGTFGVSGTVGLSAAGALSVNSPLSWSDASTLTLATTSSGNITLGNTVSGTSGRLNISAGGTATSSSSLSVGTFSLTGGTWSQIASSLPSFSATDFRLTTSASFIRAKSGDGSAATPYTIADAYGLQGMASTALATKSFKLGNDIDASGTASWNSAAGFVPAGDGTTAFTGAFDGQGYAISGLTIARPTTDYVGLFGVIGAGGTVNNARLSGTVSGRSYVGMLAGRNQGVISGSYSTGTVTGSAAGSYVGNLVGENNGGTIGTSFATGSVSAGGSNLGGLAGANDGAGSIQNSYATGAVSGTGGTSDSIGGLVGLNSGTATVTNSYATGSATTSGSGTNIGGLIGQLTGGTASGSFWNTASSGLGVGVGSGTVAGVTGLDAAGMKTLSNFTAAGWSADDQGGTATTWRVYDGYTAPLLRGFLTSLTVTGGSGTKTYDGSASTTSVGTLTYAPGGYTTALVSGTARYVANSTNAGTYSGGSLTLGGLYSSQLGYDITFAPGTLTVNQAALTVTANNASKTYDGLAYSGGNGVSYSGFVNGETAAVLGGTLAYGGTAQGAVNAGTYTLTASGLSSANYAIAYAPGALTVNQTALTVTANNGTKTYDGLAYSGGNGVSYSGFVNGETAAVLGGTLAYGGTAQGAVNAGTYTLTASGLSSANYAITYAPGTLTVNQAALTVLTVTANNASKTYDGLAYSGGNGVSYSGFVNGETAAVLGGTLAYGGTAQGAVNAGTYTLTASGLNSANYAISYVPGTLTINQAALVVTANNASKTYDGLAYSGGNGVSYSGFVNGETAAVLGGTLAYGGTAQGAVNAGRYTLTASGLNSANYAISYAPGTLTINRAALTVMAGNATKTYDGLAYSGGNGVSYSGFVNGETAAVLGGTLAYGGTAQGAVNAGIYALTASGLSSANYAISYAPGTLTINRAALTVMAGNATKTYDGLAYSGGNGVSYSGFVNGETAAVLGGTLAYGGTAQGAVDPGRYTLTASGLSSANYAITYAPGALTVDSIVNGGGSTTPVAPASDAPTASTLIRITRAASEGDSPGGTAAGDGVTPAGGGGAFRSPSNAPSTPAQPVLVVAPNPIRVGSAP